VMWRDFSATKILVLLMQLVDDLDVSDSVVAPEDLVVFEKMLPYSRLPGLKFARSNLTTEFAVGLAKGLAGCSLRRLDLSGNALSGEALLILSRTAANWPDRMDLNLSRNAFSAPDPTPDAQNLPVPPAITALQRILPKCKNVELRYNALVDLRGLEETFEACRFERLGLANNGMYAKDSMPEGILGMKPLFHVRARELDLSSNSFGVTGGEWLRSVAASLVERGLERLNVVGCDLRKVEVDQIDTRFLDLQHDAIETGHLRDLALVVDEKKGG